MRIIAWAILSVIFTLPSLTTAEADAKARPGIDRILESPYLEQLQGKRIAVLGNPVSRTSEGVHLVDLLHPRKDLQLKTIFAPEHGFRGSEDIKVPDSQDPVTGLPVYSLYGPRRAPTPELLSQIDVVIIDLQDVGVRYYTYAATAALTLKACREAGKKVMILDRPNPMGGEIVEGAVLETALSGSIAAYYPMSTRHGMTLGELGRFFNRELRIGADLEVVPVEGWKRSMTWEQTGLKWIAPSPALLTVEQTVIYGILGPMESLNLAVGRGVDNRDAFHVYGAPWITDAESKAIASKLNALKLPGLVFSPVQWTATRREYQGQLCRGFRVELEPTHPAAQLEGFRSLIEIIKTMRSVLGARLVLQKIDAQIGTRWIREGLERGMPTTAILDRVDRESEAFLIQRRDALIYP